MTDLMPYVSIDQTGPCKVCGQISDLRCGVCWGCAGKVSGEAVSATTHRLWESENPRNEWFVSVGGH